MTKQKISITINEHEIEDYLRNGNYYLAFHKLNEANGSLSRLRKIGKMALDNKKYFQAFNIYGDLNDEANMKKAIFEGSNKRDRFNDRGYDKLTEFVNWKITKKVQQNYDLNFKKYGFSDYGFSDCRIITAANEIYQDYDFSVPIASAGLFSANIFEIFGLKPIPIEYHRKIKENPKWHESPEKIRGKKIIVFEDDVITGQTLRAVGKEIRKFSPARLDILLNTNLREKHEKGYSAYPKIPKFFENIYTPDSFSPSKFPGAVEVYEDKVKSRKNLVFEVAA